MDWMLVVTVLLGVLAFLFARDERRRGNAYQAYCSSHGYRFVETSAQGFHGLAPIFLDTSQATRWRLMSQEWRYVITGQYNSTSFTAFEYRSVETFTGSDPVIITPTTPRDRRKQTYGVLLWEQPDARLPEFLMVPETMWKRFEEALGRQNIGFPDDSSFSGLYRLQGYDESAVRQLFAPAVRNHLRQHGRLHLAGFRTQLIWWTEARLPSATQLPAFLAEGDALRRLFYKP